MSGFVDFLHEAFEPFGAIRTRRMFGGHGVYHDDVMIGLVAGDELFLKVDGATVDQFKERGLGQFQYPKGDKLVGMSYFQAPEEVYDDPDELCYWAGLAFDAALRSNST